MDAERELVLQLPADPSICPLGRIGDRLEIGCERRIVVDLEVGRPGGRQILVEDPDGNPIELIEPAR